MADSAEIADAATTGLGFDPVKLREKYRAERDKRLRVDGNEQYVEVKGDFAHYLDAVSYTHLTLPTILLV